MAFTDILLTVGIFLLDLFKVWINIFIVPFKNPFMLWIIIPIWVTWFFTEFFQEKKGTSLGNAVTNGGIMIWVGIEWIRFIVNLITEKTIKLDQITYIKIIISIFVLGMGLFIVINGIKQKNFIHFVGRVRLTTYMMVMMSPIVYGVSKLDFRIFLAAILYAPLFYFVIELIDKYTPHPKTFEETENSGESSFNNASDGFPDTANDFSTTHGLNNLNGR